MTDLAPPQNLDAERSVLAAMLLAPEAIERAERLVTPRAFYRTGHALIFKALVRLHASMRPADLVTLSAELRDRDELELVGGSGALANVMEYAGTTANLEAHCELLLRAERQRELQKVGSDLSASAATTDDPIALGGDVADRLRDLSAASSIRTGLVEAVKKAAALTVQDLPKPENLLGGGLICSGDLVLFAGQPGLGKSHLALELGVAMARGEHWMGLPTSGRPRRVVYLALEFSNWHWLMRCVRVFGDGSLSAEPEPDELLEAYQALSLSGEGGAFWWVTRQQVEGGLDLVSRAGAESLRRLIEALSPDIVIADALSRSMGDRDETNAEFSALVRNCDDIRYASGAAVMFIHHEKKVEDRTKTDRLSMVRGGTKLTAGVNVVITCSKTASGLRAVYFDKANYAREPEPIHYEIPEEGGPTVLCQAPSKAADKNIETVWGYIQAHREGVTAEEVTAATGLALRTVRRHLERLQERGIRRVRLDHRTWSWRVEGEP